MCTSYSKTLNIELSIPLDRLIGNRAIYDKLSLTKLEFIIAFFTYY